MLIKILISYKFGKSNYDILIALSDFYNYLLFHLFMKNYFLYKIIIIWSLIFWISLRARFFFFFFKKEISNWNHLLQLSLWTHRCFLDWGKWSGDQKDPKPIYQFDHYPHHCYCLGWNCQNLIAYDTIMSIFQIFTFIIRDYSHPLKIFTLKYYIFQKIYFLKTLQ